MGFGATGSVTVTGSTNTSSNLPPIWSSSANLGQAPRNVAFTANLLATDPEGTAIVYSAASLPTGLSLNTNTGVVTGTPTNAAGNYTFVVQASDGLASTSQTFSLELTNAAPVWTTAAGSLGSFVQNAAINISLAATDANNDAITFTIVSGALPTGVTLSGTTISGSYGTVGTYNFTIRASDGTATTDRAFSFSITSAISAGNWVTVFGTDDPDEVKGIDVDNSGNVYLTGSLHTSNSFHPYFAKFDAAGDIVWQKYISSYLPLNGADYDSSGNIYQVGSNSTSGVIIKCNSSGSIVWQKIYSGVNNCYFTDVVVDTSGNIYAIGSTFDGPDATYGDVLLVKLDSSGNVLWQKALGNSGTTKYSQHGYAITVDSSGNPHFVSTYNIPIGQNEIIISKFDSSGARIWEKRFYSTANGSDTPSDIKCDSSNNVYVVGSMNNAPVYLKLDSTGNLIWQKSISSAVLSHLDINGSDIYLNGTSTFSGTKYVMIFKANTSDGSLTMQRSLGLATSYNQTASQIKYKNNKIYVGGATTVATSIPRAQIMLAKLEGDGSGTGTPFGSYNYAIRNLGIVTPTHGINVEAMQIVDLTTITVTDGTYVALTATFTPEKFTQ
jgi:hypothetical protein